MAIRIVLVDDHTVVREGVKALLEDEEDMSVAATADNGETGLREIRRHKPDVAVMDITMSTLNGVDAAKKVAADCPETRTLALSIHRDTQLVNAMLAAGAMGYLHKSCAGRELIAAVRSVAAGNYYLSTIIAGDFIRDHFNRNIGTASSAFSELTGREREVLQLLADGYTAHDAASELNVSLPTIHSHRQRMQQKLGLTNMAEIVKYAIREGLTTLE